MRHNVPVVLQRKGGEETLETSLAKMVYSATPPYDHVVITTTLFWAEKKAQSVIFLFKEAL